jgi:hypothetical protein
MRSRWHVAGAITLLLIVGFVITTAKVARAAGAPATLEGEVLSTNTWQNVVFACGTPTTASFTVTGTATGPYPGPFTEDVQVTWDGTGTVTSLSATFTIDSPAGQVTGTKGPVTDGHNGGSFCGVGSTLAFHFEADARYDANIATDSGTFHDSGTTNIGGSPRKPCAGTGGSCSGLFFESFPHSDASGPATVDLSPPDAVNDVGTSHTVTATVKTSSGAPVASKSVLFNVQGSVTTSGSCTTDANGQCSFTYSGPQLPGADLITGCADSNGSGAVDSGEPCGTATKAWLLPTTTPGHVTGGGQVLNSAGTDQNAFGFNAKSDATGVKGECTVVDPSANVKVKCLDATTLVESGTHATFFGNATVNGASTTYRIDIDDLGEPGKGKDTFRIQTATGYTTGGVLANGNIQVH